jgi:hypothetical protein
MKFSRYDWIELASLFNLQGYAGYRPAMREAPNSDATVDEGKRFLHVALKYDPPPWAIPFLARAHFEACRIAERIGVPDAFMPRVENGTLRVLDYPIGAGTAEHTDFDLFTVNLWRSTPTDHEQFEGAPNREPTWTTGAPNFHIGRLGELVGLGAATPHRVPARPYTQKAIVYFAMPANRAVLPPYVDFDREPDLIRGTVTVGETVGEWVARVTAKSRVYA